MKELSNEDRELARMIDHTLLRADATPAQIEGLCREAAEFGFASVCINSSHVARCATTLKGTSVKTCTTIGFPLGAASTGAKVAEAEQAIRDGAHELEMVLNVGMLKAGNLEYVEEEITGVVRAAAEHRVAVKVILETALLTDTEKITACQIAKRAGAAFVKTSTGFGPRGATVADVALMRLTVGNGVGVKAAGGIRTRTDAEAMIKAGATRIGASASIGIVGGTT